MKPKQREQTKQGKKPHHQKIQESGKRTAMRQEAKEGLKNKKANQAAKSTGAVTGEQEANENRERQAGPGASVTGTDADDAGEAKDAEKKGRTETTNDTLDHFLDGLGLLNTQQLGILMATPGTEQTSGTDFNQETTPSIDFIPETPPHLLQGVPMQLILEQPAAANPEDHDANQ